MFGSVKNLRSDASVNLPLLAFLMRQYQAQTLTVNEQFTDSVVKPNLAGLLLCQWLET